MARISAKNIMENTVNRIPLIIGIAMVCHAANKAWCVANNDFSQKDWDEAEQWQRDSAIKGVEFKLDNPSAGPDAQHNAWSEDKLKEGWVYGIEKDAEKKTHPCLVPFNQLPEFQQKKDKLFASIVESLSKQIDLSEGTDGITTTKVPEERDKEIKSLNAAIELTFGQKAVGASFNPSFMPEVDKVKMLFAEGIDIMEANHKKNTEVLGGSWERNVFRTEAYNAVVRASSAVVKYLTWRD